MPRVVHFEIHAAEPRKAIAFYEAVFGWRFQHWGGGPMDYWMVFTGEDGEPGINGGLLPRQGPGPVEGQAVIAYVCTVQVSSIDEITGKITEAGGVVVVPKMPIPGVGWLLYATDTQGNIFGIMQPDTQAA